METSNSNRSLQIAGQIMIAVSAAIFALPAITRFDSDNFFGLFTINYIFTVVYLFVLLGSGQLRKGRGGMPLVLLFLVLFLISAYSLNRSLPVFEESATWLGIALVVVCTAYVALPHFGGMPAWLQHLVSAAIGLALILWLYLSIYLLPLYAIGAVASIGLCISLHTFVPVLLLIFSIKWLIQQKENWRRIAPGLLSGIGASVIITVVFCVQWSGLAQYVNHQYQKSLIADNTDLPGWVKVSRQLPDNWVTERFLKSELVYSVPSNAGDISFWSMPSRRLDEVRKHDPLIMMAALFSGHSHLSENDRIRILESRYDARHKTEERLRSGADLHTDAVITNATIWPAQRLAYTEKTITVASNAATDRWREGQEAIYNFHMPEGSVVTSLSLWINGQKAKGVLSSKVKADSAYKQIVGVQSRDPSVVHWQEGNTVSVRVFPVLAGDNRVFKIGITTPLTLSSGRLQYKPVNFEGPVADGARETLQLSINGATNNVQGLGGFDKDEKGRYIKERRYNEDWELSFDAPQLEESTFTFNGKSYTLQAYEPERNPVNFSRIYLDINSAWSPAEYEEVCKLAGGRKLYAFTDEMIKLTDDNRTKVFNKLHDAAFSLFPVFSIKEPETALLITKGTKRSPNITDLAGSNFSSRLADSLRAGMRVKVYQLGDVASPYLKTLKERRAFDYEQGDMKQLGSLLDKSVFARNSESDSSIVIGDAGIRISRHVASGNTGSGADHLMRLFAYNHLLYQMNAAPVSDSLLVKEASEAYVVSPVSSLIVLETAADYKRFGIQDGETSLHNASVKSNGAVPEPHEWALIIVACGIIIWFGYRQKLAKKTMNV